jgi:hypothetical protein
LQRDNNLAEKIQREWTLGQNVVCTYLINYIHILIDISIVAMSSVRKARQLEADFVISKGKIVIFYYFYTTA